jgi:hypothetical protein
MLCPLDPFPLRRYEFHNFLTLLFEPWFPFDYSDTGQEVQIASQVLLQVNTVGDIKSNLWQHLVEGLKKILPRQ